MANYNLVVNSKFKPFSFERYIQPYQIYGQAYREVEDALGELTAKAGVWENLANEQTDPYAYNMYKTYANDLEAQAAQLAREGLNPTSRKSLIGMKSRYNKEIVPIEQAYTARQKQAEQQQQALLQDPTLMLSRRASTASLDDYIRNPQLAYESYSGKLLTSQAATAASALSKEMQEQPRKWRSILGDSYYETIMQKGFSSEAVLKAIQDNPSAAPQLTKIVEDALDSSGIRNWGDQATIARAVEYAKQGLWNAIGETQYQTLDNWRAKLKEQEDAQIREENRKAIAAQHARLNSLAINPLNIYSSRELSAQERNYKNNINDYSQYFTQDVHGNWKLTEEGLKELQDTKYIPGIVSPTTGIVISEGSYTESPFKSFMTSIGMTGSNAEEAWKNYIENSPAAKTANYDATKVTEFDYPIAGTQQIDMKDAIMTAGRGLSLKEVDYDASSKQFKDTGDELSMVDLKKDGYKVTATRFSPYGSTVMIQDDKGNVKRYRLPSGINTINEQNRDRAMTAADKWQQVVNSGYYTDAYGNVRQATPDEITYAQLMYNQSIQQAYLYHSQLGVQNKIKEQEFNPYGY